MMIAASVVATGDSGRSTAAGCRWGTVLRVVAVRPLTMATVKPPSSHVCWGSVNYQLACSGRFGTQFIGIPSTAYGARWSPGVPSLLSVSSPRAG